MKIVVIDGQGGRMGSAFIERWRQCYGTAAEIIAVGTNSIATAKMLKSGANAGATGENPVIVNVKKADYVIGPIGILAADALFGEVTEQMAAAVGRCEAKKILFPVNACQLSVAGVANYSMNTLIDDAVKLIAKENDRLKKEETKKNKEVS